MVVSFIHAHRPAAAEPKRSAVGSMGHIDQLRVELEQEVNRLLASLPQAPAAKEILLARAQANAGILVDQNCPFCGQLLEVVPYLHGFSQGCTVKCDCGRIQSEFRGL